MLYEMTSILFSLNDLYDSLKERGETKQPGKFSKTWIYPF